jgi:hypothetical protein
VPEFAFDLQIICITIDQYRLSITVGDKVDIYMDFHVKCLLFLSDCNQITQFRRAILNPINTQLHEYS